MSLGLSNARISGHSANSLKIQKITPARTSIAEDAKFIPKPHKRVSFKLSTNDAPTPLMGKGLPGSNLNTGDFGTNGISARIGRVEMQIDLTPEKDFDVIAPQEEGRQTNNARFTHYTQQYDAYGRPRIGFSREPYDFAATKYMAITSDIKFKENMDATREAYESYGEILQPGSGNNAGGAEKVTLFGHNAVVNAEGKTDTENLKLPGAESTAKQGMINVDYQDPDILGSDSIPKPGMIDKDSAQEMLGENVEGKAAPTEATVEATGLTIAEVAEKLGIEVRSIMDPESVTDVAEAHNLSMADIDNPMAISVSA